MKIPDILLPKPEPQHVQKPFHGKKILVWIGQIKVGDVEGWVSNPRLDLEIKRFRDKHAGRDPNNEETYAIMKTIRDFKLKTLADDIRINGVRQPIIVTFTGKLLDGNRRYYAVQLILDSLDKQDPVRSDFTSIPAWVIDENCTVNDEELILVQENFYPALKVEWPDYVKAQHIYSELQQGIPAKTVAQRYNWSTPKINETKRIMELIDEFYIFATTEPDGDVDGLGLSEIEAERIAAENYQFFNEAQKSFKGRLGKDFEFKQQFFRWIFQSKFSSFAEVRIAEEAWEHDRARKILLSDDPRAGKKARAIIQYEKDVQNEVLAVEETVENFTNFLNDLTTEQKKNLPDEALDKLRSSLETVINMIESYKKK